MRYKLPLSSVSLVVAAMISATPAQATTVFTSASAFQAATAAVTYNFPFSNSWTSLGTSYNLGPAAFSSNDLWGYNDGGYGSGIPYLGNSGSLLSVTTGASAIGFSFGSYFGPQTITYDVNGLTGKFSVPGHPGSSFLGFSGLSGSNTLTFTNGGELDTVDVLASTSAAVPEPATWAMMLLGFGAVGFALRRRKMTDRALQSA